MKRTRVPLPRALAAVALGTLCAGADLAAQGRPRLPRPGQPGAVPAQPVDPPAPTGTTAPGGADAPADAPAGTPDDAPAESPDTAAPDTAAPDAAAPDAATPDTTTPDAAAPDATAPPEASAAEPEGPSGPPPAIEAGEHTPERSWALFTACDVDADDRLDVFEMRTAFAEIGGAPRDVFREVDSNADGYVQWPEFDARYRHALANVGSFRVRPSRPVPKIADPAAPRPEDDPAQLIALSVDRDHDGGISPEELRQVFTEQGVAPELVENFAMADIDGSGRLDASEFAPLLRFLPDLWSPDPRLEERRRDLPADDRGADTSLDGLVDRAELEAALRVLDPALVRWTDRILRHADRTGTGRLGATELAAARRRGRVAAGLADG